MPFNVGGVKYFGALIGIFWQHGTVSFSMVVSRPNFVILLTAPPAGLPAMCVSDAVSLPFSLRLQRCYGTGMSTYKQVPTDQLFLIIYRNDGGSVVNARCLYYFAFETTTD